ncbi:MAG: adenosylmethionine--8-amino-7-oxononanoate transaminase [Rickettsiales bacterium]|nr:adenosylmethionine--8-amino-7-oxononanoate transaminase [Rickettsiales bacterium]
MKKQIKKKDSLYIWHPFTQSRKSYDPLVINSARNERIFDIDGNEYVDLISSWWVNIHGHCKKEIINEINSQLKRFEQVMFTDFTHKPAVDLAEKLVSILPENLKKVFYSDNGSTAVEIAMKVAIQYWYNKGRKKKKFLSMKGNYHGDTFGAMSVGFTSGFYDPFKDFLFDSKFISFPSIWEGKNDIEKDEDYTLSQIDRVLSENKDEIAAVILEPLIQGAGGMNICRKEFFDKMVGKFKKSGILVIFDEVMTGFGRTGKMFASDHLVEKPDIICLAKSITGGYLPLAATVFSEKIHSEFLGENIGKAFLHGHSYSANPLACAAALASIEIFNKEKTLKKIKKISLIHQQCLKDVSKKLNVSKIRHLGTIAAFDLMNFDKGYGSDEGNSLKKKFLKEGLLIRPLGQTIYLMPPYCISEDCLYESYEKIIKILS